MNLLSRLRPQRQRPSRRRLGRSIKRGVDLLGASAGLVVLSPALAAASAAILATMGRPLLFRQRRPGRGGRPFTIFKFRTMSEPRPGQSRFHSDGSRVTPVGAILRKTSLDELPELWNVLRGDMSLVGPRPLLMEYLPKYTAEQARRHEVRPGITGWAQVSGRQSIPFSRRLELDVWYVQNWSIALDLRILVRTAWQAVLGVGQDTGQSLADVDDLGFWSTPTGEDT